MLSDGVVSVERLKISRILEKWCSRLESGLCSSDEWAQIRVCRA